MASKETGEILIALLHDIGKIAVRASLEKNVWQASKSLVSILNPELEVLFDKFIKELDSKDSKIATAHKIAGFDFSGDDFSCETELEGEEEKSSTRLRNPFSSLKLFNILEPANLFEDYKPAPSFFPIWPLGQKLNIPCADAYEPNSTEIYKNIWHSLISYFESFKRRGVISLDNILHILKRHLYFVPAWTRGNEDSLESKSIISLYHHLKLTAAILSALKLAENEKKPLSLIIGRLIGFKNFCLGLSKEAQLEDFLGRYLYSLSIVKSSALHIAESLELSLVNIILESGFEFAIISATSEKCMKNLKFFEQTLNRWFFKNLLPLSIRVHSVDFSIEEAQKSFGVVWDRANRLASFGCLELKPKDFEPHSYKGFCSICLNELEEERDRKACDFCVALKDLGRSFIKGEKVRIKRKLYPNELEKNLLNRELVLCCMRDDVLDDSILLSAFCYAQPIFREGKEGVKDRLSALVMGVDHRDILFDPCASEEPISLAKAIVILDNLNTFLTHYSNWLASSSNEEFRKISPVNFGTDMKRELIAFLLPDSRLAMIGLLSDVLELGLEVRRAFRAFVGEELQVNQYGVSAGFFDASSNIGWKFFLLKAEELFRFASDPDKASSFLCQELPERPKSKRVCDSIVIHLQSNTQTDKASIRHSMRWLEFEKEVLPLVRKWIAIHHVSPVDSKQLLTKLWNVFNMWRFEGVFAFSKLEEAVGRLKREAYSEFDELLDMVYSFALRNMQLLHIPLGLVERLLVGR